MPRSEGITTLPSITVPTSPNKSEEMPRSEGITTNDLVIVPFCVFSPRKCPDQRGLRRTYRVSRDSLETRSEEMPRSEGITTKNHLESKSWTMQESEEMPRSEGITTPSRQHGITVYGKVRGNAPIRGDYDNGICTKKVNPGIRVRGNAPIRGDYDFRQETFRYVS